MSTPAGESPPPPPRLHPLLRSALFLLGFYGCQIAGGLALYALLPWVDAGAFESGGFGRSAEALLVGFVFTLPFLLALSWLFLRQLDRQAPAAFGLRLPEGGPRSALRQAGGTTLGVAGLLALWVALLAALPDRWAHFDLEGLAPGFTAAPEWWPAPEWALLLALLAGFVVQGGIEEWVVRGYVFRALKERWPPVAAAAVSSLLFARLHAANPSVSGVALLNIALAGMILAGLVERSASLWSATLAHGLWNFGVACILSLPVSGYSPFHLLDLRTAGDPRWTGGPFGPEGSLLLTPLALLAAAALWRGIWRRGPEREASSSREPPSLSANGERL